MAVGAYPISVNVGTGELGYDSDVVASTPQATDQGALLAWTFDPANVANGVQTSAGVLYTAKVTLRSAATISKLWVIVTTAGATLTADQNFLALYNSAGTRVGVTASQHTAFASAQILGADLTTPYAASAGAYYVGILSNGSTQPTFLSGTVLNKSSSSVGNAGMAAADGYRYGFTGSSQTATPSSITVGSIDPNLSATFWAAVS
jgi:hypothetical protein